MGGGRGKEKPPEDIRRWETGRNCANSLCPQRAPFLWQPAADEADQKGRKTRSRGEDDHLVDCRMGLGRVEGDGEVIKGKVELSKWQEGRKGGKVSMARSFPKTRSKPIFG